MSTGGSDANACSAYAVLPLFGAAIVETLNNVRSSSWNWLVMDWLLSTNSIEIIVRRNVYAGITASADRHSHRVCCTDAADPRRGDQRTLELVSFGIHVQFGALLTVESCCVANSTQDGARRVSNDGSPASRDSDSCNNVGNGPSVAQGRDDGSSHVLVRMLMGP